jgi:dolichol kinase
MLESAVTQAFHLQTQILSEELCALLRQVDPAVFRDEPEVRARVDRVAARVRELVAAVEREEPGGRFDRIRERLRVLLATLERATPGRTSAPKAAWTAFQREVQPAYESLALTLRGVIAPPPTVRPTNYTRSVFHLASGLGVLGLIQLLPGRAWLIGGSAAFAVYGWTMEMARRRSERVNALLMKLFGRVAHPHEHHRVNSSTWYVTALLLLAIFSPPLSSSIGVVVLAVADPAAAFIGRRYGTIRLRANRSIEGTLGFFATGLVSSFAVLLAFGPHPSSSMLAVAAVAAAAGALAELVSTRLDDNFTIPVVVATAAAVMGAG